jgi:hypothetical protein
VRRDVELPQVGNEIARVAGLVGTKRLAREHSLSRLTFRQAVGLRQVGIDDQPVAVLRQLHGRVAF